MKFVHSLFGAVAIHLPADNVVPETGLVLQDFIEFVLSLETIDNGDFIIERRVGEPYSENRYFCSAPTSTRKHIQILEVLEREVEK